MILNLKCFKHCSRNVLLKVLSFSFKEMQLLSYMCQPKLVTYPLIQAQVFFHSFKTLIVIVQRQITIKELRGFLQNVRRHRSASRNIIYCQQNCLMKLHVDYSTQAIVGCPVCKIFILNTNQKHHE